MIVNGKLDLSKVKKTDIYEGKKGKYLSITVFINDEVDDYGNDASFIISQTKEQREAKEARVYLGNGKVSGRKKEPETISDDLF
jgi:hypothetical protein